MARIAGVDLPREKRIEIGLTYVYGIGRTTSNKILAEAGVNPDTRVRNITDDEVKRISEASVFRKSAATGGSVTVRDCLFAVRTPRTMQEPARDPREPLLTRRSKVHVTVKR